MPQRLSKLATRANQPVELASLAALRIMLGLLISFGAARFIVYGWVERFFVKPQHFLHYWGFEWVQVLPAPLMHAAFIALTLLGLMVAAGLLYRPAIILSFLLFTYIELIDVTNYLNHYYLVSLLSLLFCFLPADAMWSLDAKRRPQLRRSHVPAYMLWLVRAQVALVYINAGLAKLGEDWLVHAQPLNIWLNSRSDLSLIGPYLGHWHVALAMSWAGFLFDTFIVAFLMWPRTRHAAYIAVLIFHLSTSALFNIGLFPLIMIAAATIFFEPGWPRRLRSKPKPPSPAPQHTPAPKLALVLFSAWVTIQALMPLRAHLYPGQLLWHEQGMRWAWRVMVREKNGSVTYRASINGSPRHVYISPSRYMSAHQERELSGQPDMILQLGRHIGHELERQGHDVKLYVDALVSLNGRPMQRLIDPTVNLMRLEDTLWPAQWILDAPTTAPPRLRPIL